MGFDETVSFVEEKLQDLWLGMEDFWRQFLNWFDKVFPPETRGEKLHQWLAMALPFLITGVAVFTLLWCCYKCCCGGGGRVRMMKAPGRNCRMPRHVFEANPKSYFSNLRSNPGDLLC